MNTAVRAIGENRFQTRASSSVELKRPRLVNLILIIALVFSAFGVIYIKDLNRRLFIQYQGLEATHSKLYEDWGKLLLEQSTWSTAARVKKIAQQRLNMDIPAAKDVVVLRMREKKV